MDFDTMYRMPKVELHCHLDGSLTKHTIEELLGREVSESEIRIDPSCRSLGEFLEKFALPLSLLQTADGLRRAAHDFLIDVSRENVRYIEVRFAPLCSTLEGLSIPEVMESVIGGLEEARDVCGTDFGVIVCAMRGETDDNNLRMFEGCRDFLGHGVCAGDLAGDEAPYPMSLYMDLFKRVRAMGFPLTIHAGECGQVRNIIDAAAIGAARIGHGIALRGNTEAKRLVAEKGIGVELCPLSNLQTRSVDEPEHYPLREFLDAGILAAVNTDNRTISSTTLTEELMRVQEWCALSDFDIVRLIKNAARVSFAPESVKDRVLAELDEYIAADASVYVAP